MRVKSCKKIRISSLSYNFFNFDKKQFNIVNYNILSSLFIFNKTRRLMVARTKRLLKKKATASRVWVKLGKIVFLFKKALNSRMGKGTGSFFSVRRWLNAGSRLMSFFSRRSGFTKLVLRYIRARLQVPVTFFVLHSKNVFKFRKVPAKFKRFYRLKLRKNKRYYSVFNYKFNRKKIFLFRLTHVLWKIKQREYFIDDDIFDVASYKKSKQRFFYKTNKLAFKLWKRRQKNYIFSRFLKLWVYVNRERKIRAIRRKNKKNIVV